MRKTGRAAIEWAEESGIETLHKYADPIEGAKEVSLDEAYEIAKEDPSLLWVETDNNGREAMKYYRVGNMDSGADLGIYPGEGPEEAIEAMLEDGGFSQRDLDEDDIWELELHGRPNDDGIRAVEVSTEEWLEQERKIR